MPIYEYECKACGHRLEAFQKMSEDPLKACPDCHKDELQKLVSAAGFQLKGSGWYVTDYSNKGNKDGKKDKKSNKENESTTPVKKDKADTSSSSGTTDK